MADPSLADPSLLAGDAERVSGLLPAAKRSRRALSARTSTGASLRAGWAAALGIVPGALLALPQVLCAGRAEPLGIAMAALLPEGGREEGCWRLWLAGTGTAALAGLGAAEPGTACAAACASLAADSATERLPSPLRVGVAGVRGLLAASSAAACREGSLCHHM